MACVVDVPERAVGYDDELDYVWFCACASDETECGYHIKLHLKNIVIQFFKCFLLFSVLGVLICVNKLHLWQFVLNSGQ